MADANLNASRLRELFDYDPTTGIFTYRVSCKRMQAGSIAGNITPRGYVRICIENKKYQAHRLAWLHSTGEWPELLIDHIDGNPANNRLANLRLASSAQNNRNRAANKRNISGSVGVTWCGTRKKWRAFLSLGYFGELDEAIEARKLAAKSVFGEFAPKR